MKPAILTILPESVAFETYAARLFVLIYVISLLYARATLPNIRDYAVWIGSEMWMRRRQSSEGFSWSKWDQRDECLQPLHPAQHQWLR
jgi:hypothetical protein